MAVLVLVLATDYPLRKSSAAELPIDDTLGSRKLLGLRMVPVWQNDADGVIG